MKIHHRIHTSMKKKRNILLVHYGERPILRLVCIKKIKSNFFETKILNWILQSPPVPYKSIITSLPFYAILFAHMGQNYGYETLMTELPTYMKQVLRFTLKEVSFHLWQYLFAWKISMVAFSKMVVFLLFFSRMEFCQLYHIWRCGCSPCLFQLWPIGWLTRIDSHTQHHVNLSTV